nr:hypothetical protein [Tanacetum cinerariifolium]
SASTLVAPYVMANPVTEPSVGAPATSAVLAQPTGREAVEEESVEAAQIAPPAAAEPSIDESPTAGTVDPLRITDEHGTEIGNVIDEVVEP